MAIAITGASIRNRRATSNSVRGDVKREVLAAVTGGCAALPARLPVFRQIDQDCADWGIGGTFNVHCSLFNCHFWRRLRRDILNKQTRGAPPTMTIEQ